MGQKLKLAIDGYKDFSVEIVEASVTFDEVWHQCWCIKLRVYWQTIWIDGWAFLSSLWGELVFQNIPDMKPPHFISGGPIITGCDNDSLCDLAEHTRTNPYLIADAIHRTLQKTRFIFSPVKIVGEEAYTTSAISYRYDDAIHRI